MGLITIIHPLVYSSIQNSLSTFTRSQPSGSSQTQPGTPQRVAIHAQRRPLSLHPTRDSVLGFGWSFVQILGSISTWDEWRTVNECAAEDELKGEDSWTSDQPTRTVRLFCGRKPYTGLRAVWTGCQSFYCKGVDKDHHCPRVWKGQLLLLQCDWLRADMHYFPVTTPRHHSENNGSLHYCESIIAWQVVWNWKPFILCSL